MGSARTMLPRDLLILSFSNSSQPCAKMRFGSGSPAAIRNAGQKTAWKRTISLPIRCRSAGQRLFAVHRAHISGQRVEPDVEDVLAFARHGDAPFDGGAADGEIVAGRRARTQITSLRRDSGWMKSGLSFVELQQLVREGRELEEVIFFGDGFGGAAAIGAGVAGLGVVDVEIRRRRSIGRCSCPYRCSRSRRQRSKRSCTTLVRGAGSVVRWKWSICEAEQFPLPLEFVRDDVGRTPCGVLPARFGGALDFLAVLVGAGGEDGVVALHALEALDGVGGDGGVGVADVRRGVDVVDRSGEVVFHRD